MDEIVEAAVLFWLPLAFIPLGLWFSQIKPPSLGAKIGALVSLVGVVLVLASPWTVPESPSSAVGHLFGFIAGPTIMILIGLFKVAYSGNVPVGRLPSSDRNFGALLFLLGIIWFSLMHWWEITPKMSSGEVNPYWLIFLPNLLLSLSSISMAGGLAMLAFGDSRRKESRYLFAMSLSSFLFLTSAMNLDSSNVSAVEFREYVWLSIADLIGITIGSILAILSFALVIFVYEKSLVKPESISPPTKDELSAVSDVVKQNIGGEE
jgi:hypothetical protein